MKVWKKEKNQECFWKALLWEEFIIVSNLRSNWKYLGQSKRDGKNDLNLWSKKRLGAAKSYKIKKSNGRKKLILKIINITKKKFHRTIIILQFLWKICRILKMSSYREDYNFRR